MASTEFERVVSKPLRALRQKAGWTQEQLAARLGVEPGTYSRYETGSRRMSLDFLGRAVVALGVPAWAIFAGERDAVPRIALRKPPRQVRSKDEAALLLVWTRLRPVDRARWLDMGRRLGGGRQSRR